MKIGANGIQVHYELTGRGKCFALIHGAGDNLKVWYKQVPVFSQYYQVLTYDVRGHGQTELPEGEFSNGLWVQDLHALLEALGITETFLLGHSMGSAIALQFTLKYPDLVKALILSNGATYKSRATVRAIQAFRQANGSAVDKEGMAAVVRDRIPRFFSPGFPERDPVAIQKYKAILLEGNREGYKRQARRKLPLPTTLAEFRRISCPVLIIAGSYDPLLGNDIESAKATCKAIPDSKLRIFPTGHPTAIEQPEEYNREVLEFLSGIQH